MFKVNKRIEYALIALKHMHAKYPGELTTAKEISSAYRTPFDVTSRVLQLMAGKSWLRSEQGAQGGYQIIKDFNEISFLDLVECLVGSVQMANCLYDDRADCDLVQTCNIISPITKLNRQLKDFYASLPVKDLMEETTDLLETAEVKQEFLV